MGMEVRNVNVCPAYVLSCSCKAFTSPGFESGMGGPAVREPMGALALHAGEVVGSTPGATTSVFIF